MNYDKIILGAGLYSALYCAKQHDTVLVLEYDPNPFMRATYINQARVHMGYHYPRSYSTAIKSAGYFRRFNEDYGFCINREFEKIYATSNTFSWTNAKQFKHFCNSSHIPCDEISVSKFFNEGMCDGAFVTKEYTYDAEILKQHLLDELRKFPNVEIKYGVRLQKITVSNDHFEIITDRKENFTTDFLLNATYASTNQIINSLDGVEKLPLFKIKYELCEIILCNAGDKLSNVGITVMDGPFFSIMPFGKTGIHSLTSVTFTPHITSYEYLPRFECQARSRGYCSSEQLGNCNECSAKPETAWGYMSNLAKKYLLPEYKFKYLGSLFSMKPILQASEIDDSRPTVIRQLIDKPRFISVLSGKINTVYDLDEVLKK